MTIHSHFQRPVPATLTNPTSAIQIVNPTRNSVSTDLDSIQVRVTASPDVTRILVVGGTEPATLTTGRLTGTARSVFLPVHKGSIGRMQIAALAFNDSALVQYDTLGFTLATSATLTSLTVEPSYLYATQGDSTLIQVIGTFSDSVDRELTAQPGMTITFDSSRAWMGSAGWVVGLTTGLDSLRVTYGGHTAVVPVEVVAPQPTGLPAPVASLRALAVWPNPAQQSVRVSGAHGAAVGLVDLLGRVVRTHAPVADAEEITLDLRGLPAGVYIVRAGTAARRLLIER